MKAFAYLRVSGRGQVDGDGFDRQLSAIRSYAAAHDITIARAFREEGVSGTLEGMDRPAWVEMITGILTNGVKRQAKPASDRSPKTIHCQTVSRIVSSTARFSSSHPETVWLSLV